jgi:hypothetical protein
MRNLKAIVLAAAIALAGTFSACSSSLRVSAPYCHYHHAYHHCSYYH